MTPAGTKVVGYVRVSSDEQGDSGAGLAAQRHDIEQEAERRGWQLVGILEDVASGKSTSKRPSLDAALALIEAGGAGALAVAKLDRLSRSVIDFATLMERARSNGWSIVVLDLDIDTTKPNGKLVANVLASLAEWERDMISQRTKDGLAARRREGVHAGRPRTVDDRVVRRILRHRLDEGRSLAAIAEMLDADGIPTAQGGRQWHPSTVLAVLKSNHLQAMRAYEAVMGPLGETLELTLAASRETPTTAKAARVTEDLRRAEAAYRKPARAE